MPRMSKLQFEVLFNGAFGQAPEEFGLTVDDSDPAGPVARRGDQVVSLLTANDMGIEWQLNGARLAPFGIAGTDTAGRAHKARNRQSLEQVLA